MFDVSAHINEYRKTHEINLKEIAPGMISVQKWILIVRNYFREVFVAPMLDFYFCVYEIGLMSKF